MCKLMVSLGQSTGSHDIDQSFQEARERIEAAKGGFVFFTVEGSGRYYNKNAVVYVIEEAKDQAKEEVVVQDSAEETQKDPAPPTNAHSAPHVENHS